MEKWVGSAQESACMIGYAAQANIDYPANILASMGKEMKGKIRTFFYLTK